MNHQTIRPSNHEPDLWFYERRAAQRGYRLIAGVDEAGRGPLAGPVVAAAVILPPDFPTDGIRDSKQLRPLQREDAYQRITQGALAFGVGICTHDEIDRINILQATHKAMRAALSALNDQIERSPSPFRGGLGWGQPTATPSPLTGEGWGEGDPATLNHQPSTMNPNALFALVDGRPVPSLGTPHEAIPHGDALSVSISAASIVAKVTRDRIMQEFDALYPVYGFARHKGYLTPEHLEAITIHGPCEIHRKSFAPIRREEEEPSLFSYSSAAEAETPCPRGGGLGKGSPEP